jgi:hypothetical protein
MFGLQQGRQVPEPANVDLTGLKQIDQTPHPLSPGHRTASERLLC